MSFEKFFDDTKSIPVNPLVETEETPEEIPAEAQEEDTKDENTKEVTGENEEEKSKESKPEEGKEGIKDDKIQNVLKKFGIENPDESVAKMAKSYSEVEKALHRNFQEVSTNKKELAEIKDTMARLVDKLDNQDREEEKPKEMTEEEKEKTIQELFDLMYENPLDFADKLYELKLGKKIEQQITDYMEKNKLLDKPEQKDMEIGPEEKKWVDFANEFISEKGLSVTEVQKLSPEIDKFLMENPDVVVGNENPYIVAYDAITKKEEPKKEEAKEKKKEFTLADINGDIKKQIIEEYKKSIEKPPQTITKKGGPTIVAPPKKPKDVKEASKLFRQQLGLD